MKCVRDFVICGLTDRQDVRFPPEWKDRINILIKVYNLRTGSGAHPASYPEGTGGSSLEFNAVGA
jgi:hypothetical protein